MSFAVGQEISSKLKPLTVKLIVSLFAKYSVGSFSKFTLRKFECFIAYINAIGFECNASDCAVVAVFRQREWPVVFSVETFT